jgi:hypothetical protein
LRTPEEGLLTCMHTENVGGFRTDINICWAGAVMAFKCIPSRSVFRQHTPSRLMSLRQSFPKCRTPPGGGRCSSEGDELFVWRTYLLWTEYCWYFAWLNDFTYNVLVPACWLRTTSSAFFRAKVTKAETWKLAELCVKSVYLNLFGWRGRDVHETF